MTADSEINQRVNVHIIQVIRRATTLLLFRVNSQLKRHDMNFIQWSVMTLIRNRLVRTAADISRELAYDSGAVARILDQLEDAGLIQRRRSPQDRRLMKLALTGEGLKTAETLAPTVTECFSELFSEFTNDEVSTLEDLLKKLIHAMNQCPGGDAVR